MDRDRDAISVTGAPDDGGNDSHRATGCACKRQFRQELRPFFRCCIHFWVSLVHVIFTAVVTSNVCKRVGDRTPRAGKGALSGVSFYEN